MQTIIFLRKQEIAEGTDAFYFTKPEGFSFVSGQSLDWTIANPKESDAEGMMRPFSILSAPHEEHLSFATRMRDTAFKRTLATMEVGAEMTIEGPFGSFMLHENVSRPAVMLCGGIGITPFRSIIADATHRKLPHTIHLFYSNRRPEDTPFLEELQAFELKNENYTLTATMTDMEKSSAPWSGEKGYIDQTLLMKYLPAGESPIFYLAGPKPMVSAMRELLAGMKVSADDIRFEEFPGY